MPFRNFQILGTLQPPGYAPPQIIPFERLHPFSLQQYLFLMEQRPQPLDQLLVLQVNQH